jgi:hypothetical protein
MRIAFCITAVLLGLVVVARAAEPSAQVLTYPGLVHRLTDLEHLATLPPAGEHGAQASSYDRASKYDAQHDRYIAWDANDDGRGIIRREGNASVLAEITGPGCIWRTWSATPGKGHVRIFFDGAETPAVDLPFTGFFDRKNEPFTRPELVYKTTANGFNNYTPMPFAKSCKIVADEGWGNYFHFTYTQFAPGTQVPAFSRTLSESDAAALDQANRLLAACGQDPAGDRPGQQTQTKNITLAPGSTAATLDLAGPSAITALRIKLDLPSDPEAQRTLLRQLTLQITWDDQKQPAVWAPLGDFFASCAGAAPFRSLPAGLLDDGTFYSYWYMPFASAAHITLGNDGSQNVPVQLQVTTAPLTAPLETLTRFHAKWHRDAFLPTRHDRAPDWTILNTTGRGRYIGVALHVWNPGGGWWGEGDEKFFVDGEKFPSTIGTGSEDFFGYAWSSPNTFVRPFHDQPLNENNAGHVSVDRWEIAENIPFQQSFEGCIEKYFPNTRPTLYAAVAYWYLAPGGTDDYTAAPVEQRLGYAVRPPVFHEKDVLEAETLPILVHPAQHAGPQRMTDFAINTWSNDTQLFWQCRQEAQELTLGFPVAKPGRYHVLARFTKAPDYGIFRITIDGTATADPADTIDLYDPQVTTGPATDLGTFDLPAGPHKFTIKATGKNPSSRGLFFGLDYARLVPQQ